MSTVETPRRAPEPGSPREPERWGRLGEVRRIVSAFRSPKVWVPIVLTAIGLSNAVLRYWMLGRYIVPSSADHGLYLALADILVGKDVEGFGLTMSPLLPLVLLGLLQVLDPITAVRLLASFPIAMLSYPFYGIVSRYTARPWALMGTLLFVYAEGYSEMAGWGGAPDLFATAWMLASLLFLLRYLDRPNLRGLVLAGAFGSLVAGSHHLTFVVFGTAMIAWMALEAAKARDPRAVLPFVKYGLLVGAFSVPYVPTYVWQGSQLAPQLTPLWPEGIEGIQIFLVFIFRDAIVLWGTFAVLGGVAAAYAIRARRETLLMAAFAIAAFVQALTFIRDNPGRPLYFLYFPLLGTAPSFFSWLFRNRPSGLREPEWIAVRALLVGFAVIGSATMVGTSVTRMSTSVDWYHAIEDGEFAALNWIKTNTSAGSVVATAGLPFFEAPEGSRFAWWIEGYAERRAFYAGTVTFAAFTAERRMVEDANRFFSGDLVLESGPLRVAENLPSSNGNPGIDLWNGRFFRPVAYLDDSSVAVALQPNSGPPTRTNLYAGANGSASLNGTGPQIEAVRSVGDLVAARSETLRGNEILVSYHFEATNATIQSVQLPLWPGYGLVIEDFQLSGAQTTFRLTDLSGLNVDLTLDFLTGPGGSIRIAPTNADPKFGVPQVLFELNLTTPSQAADVGLRITFSQVAASSEPATAYDGLAIAQSYGVTYVFQTKKRLYFMYLRFASDPVHFVPVFENEAVAIYEFRYSRT